MPAAIQLRDDNLEYVINLGAEMHFDLRDLRDELEVYTEEGMGLMLITDGTPALRNVTFTTMSEEGFRQTWKFADHENPNLFVRIERV